MPKPGPLDSENPPTTPRDVRFINKMITGEDPREVLAWAWDTFCPGVVMTSSFQTQSIALLHLLSITRPQMPVIFFDTGFHFPETWDYIETVRQRLTLNIEIVPAPPTDQQPLYDTDPDGCCELRKVRPFSRRLLEDGNLQAWVSGVRREQTRARQRADTVELYEGGLLKINPLVTWTGKDVWRYIREHSLPIHPLYYKGYKSIGCWPCTQPVREGEDERAGRWRGENKNECGLHTFLDRKA